MSDDAEDLALLTSVDDEVEARAIADLLGAEEIAHSVQPLMVSQYPGVRSGGGKWGDVRVRADQLDRARELLAELRGSGVGEEELADQALSAAPVEPRQGRRRDDRAVALVISLLLSALLIWLLYRDW
jgi:hypothetical protein